MQTETLELERLNMAADVIRGIAIDAVQMARSGHMGTPAGCAEIGAYLFGSFLKIHPDKPSWENRDRFVLSAGHASLLIYSGLYLLAYPISESDLANYRRLGSVTPSHPDVRKTVGVDASTGLDGQGIGYATGMALAKKMLSKELDYKVIALAGDGCFMEGLASEASSLAGHLCLNDLIVIYDSNKTSLDGYVTETFSEDIQSRYRSYGWDVIEVDGNSIEELHAVCTQLRKEQNKPCLIVAHTEIGKGVNNHAGTYQVHNGPIDSDDAIGSKKSMQLDQKPFAVPPEVRALFDEKNAAVWQEISQWSAEEVCGEKPDLTQVLQTLPERLLGREISHRVLQTVSKAYPKMCVGSADLARSDRTFIAGSSFISKECFDGKNIKFGVREFGMGTIAAGLALSGLLPVIGTFLAFSDYMKSAIRMIAQMELQVIFHFTHDSFLLGEDGPTHQPVEQLATLRAIPDLQVIRPADHREIIYAWQAALDYSGPTAIVLPRQEIRSLDETEREYSDSLARGAYSVHAAEAHLVRLFATGSELSLALEVCAALEEDQIGCAVISVPSWELFAKQPADYRNQILGRDEELKVSIEAGSSFGWERFISSKGIAISLDHFGESGSPAELREEFGFTVTQIKERILNDLKDMRNTRESTSSNCST